MELLTRIGQISWFYSKVNLEIEKELKQILVEKVKFFKLNDADQNYKFLFRVSKRIWFKT